MSAFKKIFASEGGAGGGTRSPALCISGGIGIDDEGVLFMLVNWSLRQKEQELCQRMRAKVVLKGCPSLT